MSKFGVGVGEDFPVAEQGPEASKTEQESRGCGYRGRRHALRQFRRRMKAEWMARHPGFCRQGRGGTAEDFHNHPAKMLVIGGLAVAGLAALIGALGNRR